MKIPFKPLHLVYLIIFISASSFSQQGNYLESNFKSGNATDTIFNKQEIIVRSLKKDTLEISGFKNGALHGKKTLYYENGEIQLIANYHNGLLKGKVEYFARRTKYVSKIEHYKTSSNDSTSLLHGAAIIYYSADKIQEKLIYKNGTKNGKYTIYHTTGEVKEKGKFKNNLNVGNKLTYSTNGKLQRDENFIIIDNPKYIEILAENGKKSNALQPEKLSVLDGPAYYYHYNGNIASETQFKNGKKDGLCKEYHQDENKTLRSAVEFKEGLEHGSFIHYDKHGEIERQGMYYREIEVGDTTYKGVYDGRIIVYNNGKLQRIENWDNFMRNGVQEDYSYHTGQLSQRMHFKDNLKSGLEERFDTDGIKSHEAHFEIVEIDGKKVSQQTGLTTTWVKGEIRTKTNWKNGKQNGLAYTYYENGALERIMNYAAGELDGLYKSYYVNGQIREDYLYKRVYGSRKHVGWNKSFDESGSLTKIFHAQGNDKNTISLNFENGQMMDIATSDGLSISLSDDQKIKYLLWQKQNRSIFGYYTFTNEKLRKVAFDADHHHPTTANFTSTGKLIQVYTSTGNTLEDVSLNTIAQTIADQYNPEWNNEKFVFTEFKDGKHQWNYLDGSPFFKIEFKDSLPNGTWIAHNPIDGDTLVYAQYDKGLPVGNAIEKTVDGVIKSRVSYFSNHQIKENYRYESEGLLKEVRKYDSLGKENYYADYYENGNLKSIREPALSNSITMWPNGDTSYFNFLYTVRDSIRLERQFYEGNILKLQRKNNLTTGFGEVKTYYENGQLKTSHELKDGKSHGLYKHSNEKGELITTGDFKDGNRHGKWIKYDENGDSEISQFENGEFIIDKNKEDPNSCVCYDKSLPSSQIGYAGSLTHFTSYEEIKDLIPKTIIPIDSFNIDNIFYVGLQTDNNRTSGFTGMKLLMFKDFSFHYPAIDYLKFNLNPCHTQGYISNIESTFSYSYSNIKTLNAYLGTKTISIGLVQNPLVDLNNKPYTILFDTKGMRFDEKDITSIHFINADSTCYPLGIIKDLMKIEISQAKLDIHPYRAMYADLPLLPNELQQFYGFNISDAKIDFDYISNTDTIPIKAKTNRLIAGSNYVAGRIEVEGKSNKANDFTLENSGSTIKTNELQRFLEEKGFYRVKVEIKDQLLLIEFYTEK